MDANEDRDDVEVISSYVLTWKRPDSFCRAYGHSSKNFMSNEILGYVNKPGRFSLELSRGSGIMGGTIWGVTIALAGGKRCKESACFHSRAAADDFIREVLAGKVTLTVQP